MKALVLEKKGELSIRDVDVEQTVGPEDVRIRIHTVGVCGSDVHYYTHGKIGPFVVDAPMIMGHEASGTVIECGVNVRNLKVGDRVCMEPGIPNLNSRASKLGVYNVDPDVVFWATPPVDGCLMPEVVHPAAFTYRLPETVSFEEGALMEPFAIGMQSAAKAKIAPGDTAVVTGAGPIGMMVALAALAGGCARVFVSDLKQEKLDIIGQYDGVETVNIAKQDLVKVISDATDGWGADIVFEASGAEPAIATMTDLVRPAGCIVLVGMPVEPVKVDIVAIQAKEARVETVFRYANMYDRAINLAASGKVDLKPLISRTYEFSQSIDAFNRAVEAHDSDVKIQIRIPETVA